MKHQNKHKLTSWLLSASLALCMGLSVSATSMAEPSNVQAEEGRTLSQPITIMGITFEQPFPYPECNGLAFLSNKETTCVSVENVERPRVYSIAEYVPQIGEIWYPYSGNRPPHLLALAPIPKLGLDSNKNVVYLSMTTAGLKVHEEVFKMLKAQLGEPDLVVTKNTDDFYVLPEGIFYEEWTTAHLGTDIYKWNNEEVWATYVSQRRSHPEDGLFVIGLKKILIDGNVPKFRK